MEVVCRLHECGGFVDFSLKISGGRFADLGSKPKNGISANMRLHHNPCIEMNQSREGIGSI